MRFLTWPIIFIIWISSVYEGSTARHKQQPRIKHESKRSFYVSLNDTVRLPCRPKRELEKKAKIVYYWTKESTPIPVHKNRHRIVFNQYLEITNIQSFDHGNYTCVAMNVYGEDELHFQLYVINRDVNVTSKSPLQLPSITPFPQLFKDYLNVITEMKIKFYTIGKQAKLKCLVKGSPAPSVKWYRNGKWISRSPRIYTSKKGKVLKIRKFSLEDVGTYVCFASNGIGTINMTVVANHYKEYFPEKVNVAVDVKPGQNLTLACQVSVHKMSYLTWVLPEPLRPFNKEILTIDVQKETPLQDANNRNATRVIKYILYHANASIHDGTYLCRVAFVNSDRFFTIKEYKINVISDPAVVSTGSGNKVLIIACGVTPAVITIFIVICICFRCHKKQSKPLTTNELPKCNHEDDEGDTVSLHVLPKDPQGQLTVHVNETDGRNQYASNIIYTEVGTLERRVKIVKQSSNRTLRSDPSVECHQECCEYKSEMSLQKINRNTKDSQRYSVSSHSWPGHKSQFDESEFHDLNENKRLLEYRTNQAWKCKKTSYRTDTHHDEAEDEEDDDNILNREKKKWEDLIIQGRDKNDNYPDVERTQLLSQKIKKSTMAG